jgi:PAS domain S-box-containing protein
MAGDDSLTDHERLERLSVATQAAGIFVWELDWSTNEISFDGNRLEQATSNRHYGQELNRELFRFVHPDDLNVGHKAILDALGEGSADAAFRYRLRLADGSIRYVHASARTRTDGEGKPLKSLGVSWDCTAEVEAAARLRLNTEQQRKLLEHLSLAAEAAGIECWEYDYAREQFTWFHKLADDFGDPALGAEERGKRAIASIEPQDAETVRAATAKALADGTTSMTIRMRRRNRDGQLRHLQLYQRFMRDDEGRPLRALGATRDITAEIETAERFRAQAEALDDAQRRLERASLSIHEGHFEVDLTTGKHWASSSYYALLGYGAGELALDTIEHVDAIIHPDYLSTAREMSARQQLSATGTPYDHDLMLRHKDGSYRWFHVRGQIERDAEGRAVRLSGSVEDVHKQKLTEDALKVARQRLERAIRGTQDGLWEWDLVNHSLWVSPRFEFLLGFPEGGLSGRVPGLEGLVHPEDLEICRGVQRAHVQGDAPYDMEVRVRSRTGSYRWVRIRGEAERDSSGKPLRLAGSMQDVTDAHAARDALIRATQEAQAANRSKSAFLANVSHEIRTPMNGIIGMTSLLLDSGLGSEQREYAETIRASANSLLTVINDILDFSKIEAGKLHIEVVDMDLPGSIAEVATLLAFQAAQKSLNLEVHVSPEIPRWVRGDRQRIRQCLINLVGNAIKFTQVGRVTVDVSLAGREEDRALTRFEVRDTGIGIAAQTLPTLFRPFVQADSSTTRHFGGTGLGLSIVCRLVELMGGEVGVTSELGRGSTFWFVLPLERAAASQLPQGAPAPGAHPMPDARTPGRPGAPRFDCRFRGRVLLVEDNLVNQKVARGFLERLGCEVAVAANGLEAVEMFARTDFDLVLLDLQMPIMDGYAATARLRTLDRGARTPIVALTASAMAGQLERCLEAGMDDLITKPLDVERLQSVLEHFGLENDGRAAGGAVGASTLDDPGVVELVAADPGCPPLDRHAFGELTGQDSEFAREIAHTFLETSKQLLAQLDHCAEQGDRAAIARAAHSLKGACANIHARPLYELCGELESGAASLGAPQLAELMAGIAAERRRVAAALHGVAAESRRAAGSR